MSHRLQSRRLYIADLARRQHEMESGRGAMQPLAYRVLAKHLREALAGVPEPAARAGLRDLPAHLLPLVADVLETRHFDQYGRLYGAGAARCREQADAIIGRIQREAAR